MVKGIRHHQPSHGPAVQNWSWRNRREEEPELWHWGLERRFTAEGRSHNYGFSSKSSLRCAVGFWEKLIRLNHYLKPYPMVVQTPIVSRWPPRGGLDSRFPSHRTPAHDRQGLVLSGRYARQFGSRLLIGYSQVTYTCAYTCAQTYIYMHTHIHMHTCAHMYTPP